MNWNFKYKRATIRAVLIIAFALAAFLIGKSIGEPEAVEADESPSVVIENNNFYSPEQATNDPFIEPSIATQNAFGGNGSVK
jgi:hypothetical protein